MKFSGGMLASGSVDHLFFFTLTHDSNHVKELELHGMNRDTEGNMNEAVRRYIPEDASPFDMVFFIVMYLQLKHGDVPACHVSLLLRELWRHILIPYQWVPFLLANVEMFQSSEMDPNDQIPTLPKFNIPPEKLPSQ